MPHALFVALLGLVGTMGLATIVWLISLVLRDVSIVDIYWGSGFVILAWVYVLSAPGYTTRALIVAILVTLWGARLSTYLLRRKWGSAEDYRYAAMRDKHEGRFSWVSLFSVFWLQALIMWIVSASVFEAVRHAEPAGMTALDIAGIVVFSIGLFFESVGDWQLARFKADPANRGKVLDRGLWRYTRHPNYFGDAMVWWGVFLLAASNPGSWWAILSPLLMTALLVKVSGVALLEKDLAKTKPAYRDYVETTSAFLPWPPRRAGHGAQ
jgi:steroid 5-alpha reductase family enzyme